MSNFVLRSWYTHLWASLLFSLVVVVGACNGKTSLEDGLALCETDAQCPVGYICSENGKCYNDDATFTVGGSVSGLAGTGLVLQSNGGDDLEISADGTFTFFQQIANDAPYAVSVATQPTAPSQICEVTNGSGTIDSADVTDVTVACTTSMFTVGGTVSGLMGTGLVLQNNGGDDLEVAADGTFTFLRPTEDGVSFSVTVGTQPTGPSQICQVTNASGTIASADVTDVTVNCTTSMFTVGGTVSGLVGTGLVLQNNGTDAISASAGAFTFPALASGSNFNVTVQTQPGAPTQTCSVSGGTGTVGSGDVTTVVVNCATDAFTVGGIVSGLVGTGLVLQNNGADDIALTSNGSFAFPTTVLSGAPYAITIQSQPSSPSQTCLVTAGSGTVAGGDVTDVRVDCTTNTFDLGGTVAGLVGSGLVLQNNAGDNLAISADGAFTFATPVTSGAAYDVTVLAQPSGPTQVCSVANDSGTVGGADVTDVTISCSTSSFTVGGTVVGLVGSGLTLQNSAGDDLSIGADGAFTFATPVASGAAYAVTISSQPTAPTQTCSVSAGTGAVGSGNVTSVVVNCATNAFTVGGTVSGLAGTVVVQNNGADDLTISSDGSFAFATPISSGNSYAVTVATQPSTPSQTCTVTAGTGTVGAANVTGVSIACTTNEFTVGGTVTGLSGSGLVLQNNAGDDLAISANGAFSFATNVASGGSYVVTTGVHPASPSQTCTIGNGSGVVGGSNVTDITVTCATDTFAVGGTVSGLSGTGLVLQNNGGDNLPVNANGVFSFATEVLSGDSYTVTVFGQPSSPSQTCTVSNAAGTVTNAAITNVAITCTTDQFSVGGTTVGLVGTGLVLQNNLGDDLAIGANGAFTFATDIDSGTPYSVTVLTQPLSPAQTCIVTGGTGSVGASDVTSVSVNCTTDQFSIGGTVTGLAGTGLVIQNNGGDDLAIGANGAFAFSTPLLSGNPYSVTVLSEPSGPTQTCAVTNGSGNVGAVDVTNVSITCTTTTFTVGGTLSGLAAAQSVVLRNNGADDLAVSADGSFTFSVPIASGQPYAVTVLTQPSSPVAQTCLVTNDAGLVTTANIANVTVTCSTNSYTVGGTVSGLTAGTVTIQNNGGDDIAISADGIFTFASSVASGNGYSVTVLTQPGGSLLCAVASGSGTMTNANITNVSVDCSVVPTGGTITTSGGFRIHTFTSTGTFQTFGPITVEYLIVAGGGGGGSGDGGGGGAGGVLTGSTALATNSFAAVVGNGGAGAGTGEIGTVSQNGVNSSFAGLISVGGGRGGQEDNTGGNGTNNNGGNGGSGGGFGGANAQPPFPAGGTGTAGQGFDGGTRGPGANDRYGMGGGGGAGGAGANGGNGGTTASGGIGGIGISSSISGSAVFYGGGGGGSGRQTSGGAGGQGGGGAGGLNASGSAGTPNTGGGGGGGGDQATTGGAGGSGIIIIRYPI